jgi:hypothetical protein
MFKRSTYLLLRRPMVEEGLPPAEDYLECFSITPAERTALIRETADLLLHLVEMESADEQPPCPR